MTNKLSDRKIVRQSHSLNFSKFSLSSLSIDILYLFFAQVAKEDVEFKEFKITFREIEKKLNKRIDKNYIEGVCNELLTNVLTIKEGRSVLKCNFVSSCRYSIEEGWLQLKISDDLKNHLLCLEKNYVLTNYINVAKLKGSNSKRIYSMLRQFKQTGFFKINVEQLMAILDIEDKYSLYGNFKKKVLQLAIDEINQKSTDLKVSYKEIKEGRKVVSLEFKIEEVLTEIEKHIKAMNELEKLEARIKEIKEKEINFSEQREHVCSYGNVDFYMETI